MPLIAIQRWGLLSAFSLGFLHPIASAQNLGGAAQLELPVFRLIIGIGLIILCALVAVIVLNRRGSGVGTKNSFLSSFRRRAEASSRIKVLETRRLSMHADVTLFSSLGREFLIVTTAGGATVLRDQAASATAHED